MDLMLIKQVMEAMAMHIPVQSLNQKMGWTWQNQISIRKGNRLREMDTIQSKLQGQACPTALTHVAPARHVD